MKLIRIDSERNKMHDKKGSSMREIKFRAWDENEKEMVEWPHLINDPDDWFSAMLRDPEENGILMEYTGLKDKQGKEIYEGDIVEVPGKRLAAGSFTNWYKKSSQYDGKVTTRCIITFEHGKFDVDEKTEFNETLIKLKGNEQDNRCLQLFNFPSSCKIIGNVYENPELTKGQP